jgi:putative ABC transport system permease protein
VALVQTGVSSQGPDATRIDEILARHQIVPSVRIDVAAVEVPYRRVTMSAGEVEQVAAISESSYRSISKQLGRETGPAALQPLETGQAWYINPFAGPGQPETVTRDLPYLVSDDGLAVRFETDLGINQRLLSPVGSSGPWFVLTDADFESLLGQAAPASRLQLQAFDWDNWERTRAANNEIRLLLAGSDAGLATERYSSVVDLRQTLSLSMFIGVFISLLFFIGAGSMLYFKLFTELPDDRRLFHSLRRVGITGGETRRVVSVQMALIFFLPFLVGALHALFALRALGNMLLADVTLYSLIVIGLFALIQVIFYSLTRWTYLRALLPAR